MSHRVDSRLPYWARRSLLPSKCDPNRVPHLDAETPGDDDDACCRDAGSGREGGETRHVEFGQGPGTDTVPPDLLPIIRASGIWSDRQLAEVREKVLHGDYPTDSTALADRLVRDKLLNDFQARRVLANRPNGLVIGKYIIIDRIGSGAMGRVYKANHPLMGRVVAVKVIAPEIISNERAVARFQREMKLVGRLDHPNVVRAFDADADKGVLYIVMEYVSGQSLGQMLLAQGRSRRSMSSTTRHRRRSGWDTPTRKAWSIAISSRRTSSSTRRSRSRCSTWDSAC